MVVQAGCLYDQVKIHKGGTFSLNVMALGCESPPAGAKRSRSFSCNGVPKLELGNEKVSRHLGTRDNPLQHSFWEE